MKTDPLYLGKFLTKFESKELEVWDGWKRTISYLIDPDLDTRIGASVDFITQLTDINGENPTAPVVTPIATATPRIQVNELPAASLTYAGDFNGTDAYVQVPYSSVNTIDPTSADWVFEADIWIDSTATSTRTIASIAYDQDGGNVYGLLFQMNLLPQPQQLFVRIGKGVASFTDKTLTFSSILQKETWYTVRVQRISNVLELYLNDILQDSDSPVSDIAVISTDDTIIGAKTNGLVIQEYWWGRLKNVKFTGASPYMDFSLNNTLTNNASPYPDGVSQGAFDYVQLAIGPKAAFIKAFLSYSSSDISETMLFRVSLAAECPNPIMLEWINEDGAYEQFMFSYNQAISNEAEQGIIYETPVVDELENTTQTINRTTSENIQSMTLQAEHLTLDQMNALHDIKRSDSVRVWLKKDGSKFVYVIVDGGYKTTYESRHRLSNFFLNIRFPDGFNFFEIKEY